MVSNKRLLKFRYVFNKLPDNVKSIVVFATSIGCFLLVSTLTNFSWAGILAGCLASYVCTQIFRPVRRKHKF